MIVASVLAGNLQFFLNRPKTERATVFSFGNVVLWREKADFLPRRMSALSFFKLKS